MWRLLIVDDEPKIRRGLARTIGGRCPGVEIVGEAEDGEEALAEVAGKRPDILLVDVRMPILGGLELIEKIQAITEDCAIIVVSGHDEFEYARKAIQLRVFDYLLKPVDQDHLAEVVDAACSGLAAARQRAKYLSLAKSQLERNMPLLREQFGRAWTAGRHERVELEAQLAFFGIPLDCSPGIIVVHMFERFAGSDVRAAREWHLVQYAVRGLVEESLAVLEPLIVFQDGFDNLVAITRRSSGIRWLEAAERIRARATPSLVQAILIEQDAVDDGPASVPEVYDRLLERIAAGTKISSLALKVQGVLESGYQRAGLGLDEVANELRLSPGYLSRVLKQSSGYTFTEYLMRIRINKAMQLMSDPGVKLYEVAERVGFASQHYFSRAFKRVLGIAPIEFRKGTAP